MYREGTKIGTRVLEALLNSKSSLWSGITTSVTREGGYGIDPLFSFAPRSAPTSPLSNRGKRNQVVRYETKSNRNPGEGGGGCHWRWSSSNWIENCFRCPRGYLQFLRCCCPSLVRTMEFDACITIESSSICLRDWRKKLVKKTRHDWSIELLFVTRFERIFGITRASVK